MLKSTLLFLFLSFTVTGNIFCQDMPMPENIQAALLTKVLKFNPNISGKAKISLLIVYNSNSVNSKDEFVSELTGIMDIKAILPEQLKRIFPVMMLSTLCLGSRCNQIYANLKKCYLFRVIPNMLKGVRSRLHSGWKIINPKFLSI